MKICLVSAFPPSRRPLNEYGFHLARELAQKSDVSLTVLGDDLDTSATELPGYSVIRCWGFDRVMNPLRLVGAIRNIQPDVVWYNLAFASFSTRPVPAFASLLAPTITRLFGYYTHVTLHQLLETVDFDDAGISSPRLYRAAGSLTTHLLLSANSLSVLLPGYRRLLRAKYKRGMVAVRPHGILSGHPEMPDLAKRGNPVHRILAFGKWGTYKRLELLIGAFKKAVNVFPSAQLLIAGQDHPKAKGYLASIRESCAGDSRIHFLGYVAEGDIPSLFQTTSVAVMPYSSSAGSSGVAHLACAYGVPIIASDITDFRELADEEGLAIEFFQVGNLDALAERLLFLLQSPRRLAAMAERSFTAALKMNMSQIIGRYLTSFEMQHRLRALKAASRLRRLPRWLPFRDLVARRVGRDFLGWNIHELGQDPNLLRNLEYDPHFNNHVRPNLSSASSSTQTIFHFSAPKPTVTRDSSSQSPD